MYTIYEMTNKDDGQAKYKKVNDSPISYNKLLDTFRGVDMPWNKISELKTGSCVKVDTYLIVQET